MKASRCLVLLAVLFLCAASGLAANVSGSWTGQFASDMNPSNVHKFVLDLKLDGSKLTGTMGFCKQDCTNPMGKVALEDGKFGGDTISFGIDTDAKDIPHIDFQGTASGDSINFIVTGKAPDCGGAECRIGQGSAMRTNPHQ
jgi:hypothetical protein